MTERDTTRIAFTVQYDGEPYFGWQLQLGQTSVQGELERVVSRLFDAPTRVLGAGRTDRGVHATGQVAVVDAPRRWGAEELRRAMNALLPRSIWVSHAAAVADPFHPRYDATSRRYVYMVGTAETAASPFHSRWCWPVRGALDLTAIEHATSRLVGDHSFRAFAKAGQEERGDRCIVTSAGWATWDIGLVFEISANRFLHHMVRYLVGTLVEVGLGRRDGADLARLLHTEAGLLTSPPAPPHGLYLAGIRYPAGSYDGPEHADAASLPSHPTLQEQR